MKKKYDGKEFKYRIICKLVSNCPKTQILILKKKSQKADAFRRRGRRTQSRLWMDGWKQKKKKLKKIKKKTKVEVEWIFASLLFRSRSS